MDFLKGIKDNVTKAGQNVAQQTKKMADIAKIDSAISEEEKKINNSYFQIGKLYVAKHYADFEEEFAGMISAVKESETAIRNYRQQLQDLKGIVNCENCGAEVANNMAFCSSCGHPMPKQSAPVNNENLVKCSHCEQMVPKNARFCTSCGKPMIDILQSQPAPQIIEPVSVKKCSNCNAEFTEDLDFCTECGTKL